MIRKHWRKSWSVCLVVGLANFPSEAFSAPGRSCDPQDPQDCVQAVTQGEPVPFTGQLLTPRRAVRLVGGAEQCEDLRALDLEEAHEICQIKIATLNDTLAGEKEICQTKVDLLTAEIEKTTDMIALAWYEKPVVISIASATLGILVFAAAQRISAGGK